MATGCSNLRVLRVFWYFNGRRAYRLNVQSWGRAKRPIFQKRIYRAFEIRGADATELQNGCGSAKGGLVNGAGAAYARTEEAGCVGVYFETRVRPGDQTPHRKPDVATFLQGVAVGRSDCDVSNVQTAKRRIRLNSRAERIDQWRYTGLAGLGDLVSRRKRLGLGAPTERARRS